MKAKFLLVLLLAVCTVSLNAQVAQEATDMVPSGKGYGVPAIPGSVPGGSGFAVTLGNGINYHSGPIMPGTPHIYFIRSSGFLVGTRSQSVPAPGRWAGPENPHSFIAERSSERPGAVQAGLGAAKRSLDGEH